MSFSVKINNEEALLLKDFLSDFIIASKDNNILWRAKYRSSHISMYKNNTLLLQGNAAELDYKFIINNLSLKNKIVINNTFLEDIIGSDEVGTGDYFGPIIVCAAYIPLESKDFLMKLKLNDSKKHSDSFILKTAPIVMEKVVYSTAIMTNEVYNEVSIKTKANIKKNIAILHNNALLKLQSKKINYTKIVVDAFTNENLYFSYLENTPQIVKNIELIEKAESKYLAVAVASIIARYLFLTYLTSLEERYDLLLPKGAGAQVDLVINKILKENPEILKYIGKINFKNTEKAKKINT